VNWLITSSGAPSWAQDRSSRRIRSVQVFSASRLRRVVVGDADEHQQTGPVDRADDLTVDGHAGRRHPLQDHAHGAASQARWSAAVEQQGRQGQGGVTPASCHPR
jgi:hypothetical protein